MLKTKKAKEVVKSTRQLLLSLSKKKDEKLVLELSGNLDLLKKALHGDIESDPESINTLCQEIYSLEIIQLMTAFFARLDFEARKDVVTIFNYLLRRQVTPPAPTNPENFKKGSSSQFPSVDYIKKNPQILLQLLTGYKDNSIALNCGAMLRECIQHEALCKVLLQEENFREFFQLVEMPQFDVASDAFTTFKELLTKHKTLIKNFLVENYELFFDDYTKLLHSPNYVTKRQSLKLLGELLLDRSNYDVMTKYISSRPNLKLMMNLLKDKSRSIQFEAFHVFKVFVANPNKPKEIEEILVKNKERLIGFLSEFHNDRGRCLLRLMRPALV
eukprot:TRINITY_DN2767_c1_g2_i6.p1 TRINITY_DN2767_c1_g2~~TRINITY_DN2767_c1_g2_i6.p1  ORF type:complete len:330 (-),score=65.63 TRINITY_DN2767_c1_g2_i6:225-1214(-)